MLLLRRTLAFFPAQLLGTVAQFVSTLIWAHWLVPEQMGTYALIWAAQEIVQVLTLSWWSAYVLRYYSSHTESAARSTLDRTELAVLGFSIFGQIITTWLILHLFASVETGGSFLLTATSFIIVRSLTAHLLERARAANRALAYLFLQVCGPVLGLFVGVFAMNLVQSSTQTVFFAYILTHLLGLVLAIPLLGYQSFRPHMDRQTMMLALRYGAPLILSSLLGWVSVQGLRLVVDHLQGAAAVGLVSVGWWLGQRGTSTVAMLVTVATFNIAVERIRDVGFAAALPQIANNGAMLLGVLVPTTIGILALNDPLVQVLVAPAFQDMTRDILPLCVLAGSIRAFRNHYADQVFLLYEKTHLVAIIPALEAALTLGFCVVGLAFGGLYGAVAGCLIAASIALLVSLMTARYIAGFYLLLLDITKITLAGLALYAALALLPQDATVTGLLGSIGIGVLVYLSIISLLYRDILIKIFRRKAG